LRLQELKWFGIGELIRHLLGENLAMLDHELLVKDAPGLRFNFANDIQKVLGRVAESK
jgi:hypothetical protein